MAGVREGTKSGKVTISQRNRTPSPRRVSDGFVCWLCDTRRTTELYYKLTPSPLCTQLLDCETSAMKLEDSAGKKLMWLVEENTNHAVLFFREHLPRWNTMDNGSIVILK